MSRPFVKFRFSSSAPLITRMVVYAPGASSPCLKVTIDPRPAKASPRKGATHPKFARATGKAKNAGQTNGMPWDGTSPVSAGAEIDAPKLAPSKRAGVGREISRRKAGF